MKFGFFQDRVFDPQLMKLVAAARANPERVGITQLNRISSILKTVVGKHMARLQKSRAKQTRETLLRSDSVPQAYLATIVNQLMHSLINESSEFLAKKLGLSICPYFHPNPSIAEMVVNVSSNKGTLSLETRAVLENALYKISVSNCQWTIQSSNRSVNDVDMAILVILSGEVCASASRSLAHVLTRIKQPLIQNQLIETKEYVFEIAKALSFFEDSMFKELVSVSPDEGMDKAVWAHQEKTVLTKTQGLIAQHSSCLEKMQPGKVFLDKLVDTPQQEQAFTTQGKKT